MSEYKFIGRMLKNTNGSEYRCIKENGKYVLLENMGTDGNKCVVAFNYDENNQCWESGSYYDDFKSAVKYYGECIGDTHVFTDPFFNDENDED